MATDAQAALSLQIAELRQRHGELLERMRSGEARFRSLARSVWRVQEEERRRIARELHDGIGQNLTALKHSIALIGGDAAEHPALRARVDAALALCSRTLEETRQLSRLLRPQILDDLGLAAALRWLARNVREAGGPPVDAECELSREPEGELRTLVFRLVQEALGNVVRHAEAAHAVVRVGERDGCLDLLVWDDGQGCDAALALRAGSEGRSAGLAGMRERVLLHGGSLQFDSAPGQGCRVRARLPFTAPQGDAA